MVVAKVPAAPSIVHQHDVQFAPFARTMKMRGVRRDRLAGGGAGEQPQEHREVALRRDDLLEADAGDVEARERRAEVRRNRDTRAGRNESTPKKEREPAQPKVATAAKVPVLQGPPEPLVVAISLSGETRKVPPT